MNDSRRGRVVVVSGPSGVGKSSIIAAVMDASDSRFSVSATTRDPRVGERDGVDYHFLDRAAFEDAVEGGKVLEWAEYGGNLYGTLRDEVIPLIEAGTNVILDIENEGAKQVRERYPEALLIFVAPPSMEALAARLRGRGDTSERDIERRLAIADDQLREAPLVYDHIIVNETFDAAVRQVLDILRSPD